MTSPTRMQRLRAAVLAVPPDDLQRAARSITEEMIRVLPPPARALASQLRRASSPADLLRRAPDARIVTLLADDLCDACLDATRSELGDAADDPTREQLLAALDVVLEEHDVALVRLMLAVVATTDGEAADLCDDLLEHDERFAIELPATPTKTIGTPKPKASDEVRARRQERRQAEREQRQRDAARAPQKRPKRRTSPSATEQPATTETDAGPTTVARRAPTLTPTEARTFSADDPLVGAVVIAAVPFDEPTDVDHKVRPCVVVAGSDDELLVRPGYSEGGVQSRRWQSHELRDLAAAGCTRPTWIESTTRAVARADASEPVGRLSDHDWNALW